MFLAGKETTFFVCATALLLGFASCSDGLTDYTYPSISGSASLLRQRFQEGSVATFTMTHEVTSTTNGEARGSASLAMTMEMYVESVKDGMTTLRGKMTRIAVDIEEPGNENTVFDSDSDIVEPSPLRDFFDFMKSSTFSMKIDARGRQTGVKRLAAASREIVGYASDIEGTGKTREIAMIAARMYGTLPRSFVWKHPGLPDEAVRIGTEWKETFELELDPSTRFTCPECRGKVESSVEGLVQISFSGIVEKEKNESGSNHSHRATIGLPRPAISDGSVTGCIEFDRFRGVILKKSVQLSITSRLDDASQQTEVVNQTLELDALRSG